jgi:sugar lactone lactonase YvrE/DNA-directed RNA polymerase subunit RPC12/RpoP
MSETFKCPKCGAPLDYQGSDPIIRCPYCSSSVIVPENLRAKPSFSSKPSSFTLSGLGDLGGLINRAKRIKEVKDLAEAGEMEQAVSLYREITGADEFSARQAVGKLAAGQPITMTGLSQAEVISAVKLATAPGIHIQPLDQQTSRSVGRAVGCFVAILTLTILAGVLIPLLGAGVGLFAAFKGVSETAPEINIPGIVIPGVEVPGLGASGFATQELTFGGEGTGPGLFGDVRAIAVNPENGNIYAANYDDGRVQVFDPQGKFITQWMIQKENTDPYFDNLVVDRNETVYVPVFGKILRFDTSGKAQKEIKIDGKYIDNLALAADGSLVAVANGETILWLTSEGQVINQVEKAVSSLSGDSELNAKVAVDGLGNVYLLGTFNNAVFVFSPDGKYLNRFGSAGNEAGQFRAPQAIEIDGKGRIFVSDIKGIQVFSKDGRYLDVIKVQYFAYGLAFDDQRKLYITTNQKKVEKYSFPE